MERRLRSLLEYGAFRATVQRSRMMGAVRGLGNRTTELRLRMELVRLGLRGWALHRHDIRGRPDFFFAAKRVAIFVDGCFWHGCHRCGHVPRKNSAYWSAKIGRNRERDAATTASLHSKGIAVIRIWECELATDVRAAGIRVRQALRR